MPPPSTLHDSKLLDTMGSLQNGQRAKCPAGIANVADPPSLIETRREEDDSEDEVPFEARNMGIGNFFCSLDITTALPPPGTNALANSAFATYVLSLLGYLVYLLHAFLPPHVLRSTLHITYYPSQAWSLALPAWLTVAVWYIYIAYASRNLLVTPPVEGADGLRSITDDSALVLRPEPRPPSSLERPNEDPPVPVLRDLPCQVVNEFYFGK